MTFTQAHFIGYELLSLRSFCESNDCGAQHSSVRLAQYEVRCKLPSETPLLYLEPQVVHMAGSEEPIHLCFRSLMWGLQWERVF
jgi:hypothetical protein